MSDVVSEPVRSPLDESVRGWVRQHTDRAARTDFGIVLDVGGFLAPNEAREVARVLLGVADEYEGRRDFHRVPTAAPLDETHSPTEEDRT